MLQLSKTHEVFRKKATVELALTMDLSTRFLRKYYLYLALATSLPFSSCSSLYYYSRRNPTSFAAVQVLSGCSSALCCSLALLPARCSLPSAFCFLLPCPSRSVRGPFPPANMAYQNDFSVCPEGFAPARQQAGPFGYGSFDVVESSYDMGM